MARRVREVPCAPEVLSTIPVDFVEGELSGTVEDYGELREMVALAIEGLPSPYRDVIEGVYFEQVSYDVLAGRLGVGHRSTIMRWRKAACVLLRLRLEEQGCHSLLQRLLEARP